LHLASDYLHPIGAKPGANAASGYIRIFVLASLAEDEERDRAVIICTEL